MKQLIIMLLLPAFTFSQTKGRVIDLRESSVKWYSIEDAHGPSKHWRLRLDGTEHYTIMFDSFYLFRTTLLRDTLRVDPSLFDSTAKNAKVIIVAGKIFKLKNNK